MARGLVGLIALTFVGVASASTQAAASDVPDALDTRTCKADIYECMEHHPTTNGGGNTAGYCACCLHSSCTEAFATCMCDLRVCVDLCRDASCITACGRKYTCSL